jgi:hypothetical protein
LRSYAALPCVACASVMLGVATPWAVRDPDKKNAAVPQHTAAIRASQTREAAILMVKRLP